MKLHCMKLHSMKLHSMRLHSMRLHRSVDLTSVMRPDPVGRRNCVPRETQVPVETIWSLSGDWKANRSFLPKEKFRRRV